jgi:hypothetical protein
MNIVHDRPSRQLTTLLLTALLTAAACAASGNATQQLTQDQAPTPAPGGSIDAGGGGGSGEATASGSLVSSGIYDATWTWAAGNQVGPGLGGITVNSDKGTFGNIEVLSDGSITFSTGAPEISGGQPYKGSGALVHMSGPIPCGFTLDNDLTGSDGKVLHMKGDMTVSGGAFGC